MKARVALLQSRITSLEIRSSVFAALARAAAMVFAAGVALAAAITLFTPPAALAHEPFFNVTDEVIRPAGFADSVAYYQEITDPAEVDTYVFEASQGESLNLSISIPMIKGNEDYLVNMALLGPGLPPIMARDLPENAALTPEFGEFGPICEGFGMGVVMKASSVEAQEYSDPYTQTSYLRAQVLELDLLDEGTYTLLITSEGESTGKYLLESGIEESAAETIIDFPSRWAMTQMFFGNTLLLVAGEILVIALLVAVALAPLFMMRRRSRRRSRPPQTPPEEV